MQPLVLLEDLKAHLGIAASDNTDNAELTRVLMAASQVVVGQCGPCEPTQFTEVITPRQAGYGRMSFVVAHSPIISVDSVAWQRQGAPAVNMTAMEVNAVAGVFALRYLPNIPGGCSVTYTAGRTSVPESLQMATLVIAQHLWETQRAGDVGAVNLGGEDQSIDPGYGFAVPNRAQHLMRMSGEMNLPGIA